MSVTETTNLNCIDTYDVDEAGIALTQKSCIFTQSASQKMHFWICNASLGRKYRNLLS